MSGWDATGGARQGDGGSFMTEHPISSSPRRHLGDILMSVITVFFMFSVLFCALRRLLSPLSFFSL
jgi:hypothetical protein